MDCFTRQKILDKKIVVVLSALFLIFILLLILAVALIDRDYCHSDFCVKASANIFKFIDLYHGACDNFYNFACILEKNKIKEESFENFKNIVTGPIKANEAKSIKYQKMFYQACANLIAIDANNDTSFLSLIDKLGGWPVVIGNNWNESAFDFVEIIVASKEIGFPYNHFLNLSVFAKMNQAILKIDVPNSAKKIDNETEKEYFDLITRVALALGAHNHVADAEIKDVIYFENKLSKLIEETNRENEQQDKQSTLTIPEIQSKWQKINWLELLNILTNQKLEDEQPVVFLIENYLPKLQKLLDQTRKRTQANYVVWKIVEEYLPFLSHKIRSLGSLDTQNRDNFCFVKSQTFFNYAAEAEFLRKHLSPQKRQKIEHMLEEFLLQLEELNGLEEDTIAKLQNMSYILGGPEEMYYVEQFDRYIGANNVELNTSDIIEISTKLNRSQLHRMMHNNLEIKNFFYELVPTMKIRYFQKYNLLWIPAGVLVEPFYSENSPNYLNYGMLGTLITHTIVQGLLGCKDHLSLEITYKAYNKWLEKNSKESKLPGLNFNNKQMFWLASSISMCHLPIINSNYSNYIITSIPAFRKDFGCKFRANVDQRNTCY